MKNKMKKSPEPKFPKNINGIITKIPISCRAQPLNNLKICLKLCITVKLLQFANCTSARFHTTTKYAQVSLVCAYSFWRSFPYGFKLFLQFYFQTQLFQLFIIKYGRCIQHDVTSRIVFGEGDAVANRIQACK